MKKILIAVALTMGLSACTQVPHGQRADPSLNANGEELICERTSIPGKIYPGKICMTEKQWANHKEVGGEATRDVQRRGLSTAAPGGG